MGRPFKNVTFWDRVNSQIKENHAWGCLEFTGCKDECGYGRINRDGKLVRLHRAVWERDHGHIPAGMVVMHSCDNPCCLEPEHLFLGTQAENVADMDRKGRRRTPIGSQQPQAKLTEASVRVVKQRLKDGATCAALAREYGVSDAAIRNVKKGRRWTHVQ